MSRTGRYTAPSLDEPCPTVATQGRLALASVQFLSKQFSGAPDDKNISIDSPAGTVTTVDHHALISTTPMSSNDPSACPSFLCSYNFKDGAKSIDSPCPTLLTKDRLALIQTQFMANEYSGGGQLSSIDAPNPAVLTNPKQKLVTCEQFLMNPQFSSAGSSLDSPCFTLIARMDKRPPYLITTESGDFAVAVYDTDSAIMIKIKEFMALYRIADIMMRMLKIIELTLIMELSRRIRADRHASGTEKNSLATQSKSP